MLRHPLDLCRRYVWAEDLAECDLEHFVAAAANTLNSWLGLDISDDADSLRWLEVWSRRRLVYGRAVHDVVLIEVSTSTIVIGRTQLAGA